MDLFIIAAIISGIVIIILSVAFIHVSRVQPQGGARPRAVAPREGGPGRVQAVRNQRARMRANAARQQAALPDEEVHQDVPEADEGRASDNDEVHIDDKMGAKWGSQKHQVLKFEQNIHLRPHFTRQKKRAKLEAKMEKKKFREAEEQLRQEKRVKDQKQEEERRKKEEKDEEENRKREEAELKAIEEQKRKEQEEYEAMKAAFSVDQEGFDENDEQTHENMLKDFVDYLRNQKVVLLEDLAAHFKLKTQAAIDRIQDLQASGELTGVIDDRGKFIHISRKELEDVAKFIKQRGRVSITDLAESSNNLINLEPVLT